MSCSGKCSPVRSTASTTAQARASAGASSLVSARQVSVEVCTPGSGPAPDGYMAGALARERLATPAAPALHERHPREARHQVELGRPHVAEGDRVGSPDPPDQLMVVGYEALPGDVELVEAEVGGGERERAHGLAGRKSLQLWHADLDHEVAARVDVRRNVLEACHLRVLAGEVVDRVEDEVGEREAAVGARRREVSDRDGDLAAARLGAQTLDHGSREVDA